jgi:hypothetical protein
MTEIKKREYRRHWHSGTTEVINMVKMPRIKTCDAKMCGYNRDGICYTIAINVGASGPRCNAFVQADIKCGGDEITSGVGACKMKECQYNDCLICTAPDISVKWHGIQALCQTFTKR